jgi:hypothetical protein
VLIEALGEARLAKAGTISQDEADYTDDGPVEAERCRHCTMFRAPDSCTLVKGDIHPDGHCRLFEAKDEEQQPPDHHDQALALAVAMALRRIDFGRWTALVVPTQTALADVSSQTVEDTLADLGAEPLEGDAAEEMSSWVADFARNRAAELVGRRWVGEELVEDATAEQAITRSTSEMIRDAVARALKEKLSSAEFIKLLASSEAFTPERAWRIADYETTSAAWQATLQAFRASNRVEAATWRTMQDPDVSADCEENAAVGEVPLGQAFPSGHHAPPAHPNCRCWLEPVLIEPVDKASSHVDPANASPVEMPLADDVTEANVQHAAWQIIRDAIARGEAPKTRSRTVAMSDLVATQRVVDEERVDDDAAYYREHDHSQWEPLVLAWDGKFYVLAGHHHTEGALETGATEMRVSELYRKADD